MGEDERDDREAGEAEGSGAGDRGGDEPRGAAPGGSDHETGSPPAAGADGADDGSSGRGVSRRELLFSGGGIVVGAALGVGITAAVDSGGSSGNTTTAAAVSTGTTPQALTNTQARTLNAILGRMIPSDETGPGAEEAMVWRYIDNGLAGDLSEMLPMYMTALGGIDDYAQAHGGAGFADLPPNKQDRIITMLEQGKGPADPTFFPTMREHALEGMFGDPAHGGNADFAGWDMIGFPGIKLVWSEKEQQVGTNVKPAHKSTYEYPDFSLGTTGA